jgi:Holliday junction resolvase RusA-like endonuclease
MKGFSEEWLREQGLKKQEDGTYKKESKRDSSKKGNGEKVSTAPEKEEGSERQVLEGSKGSLLQNANGSVGDAKSITIKLFGVPKPKQSARFYAYIGKNGKPQVRSFQPKELTSLLKEYQRQVKEQLPPDFKMFEEIVEIEEMTFIYPPLKRFKRAEMDIIEAGGFIPKTTVPDLPDNLKKLPLDAMSGIVYSDDKLIWKEGSTMKVYGTGGCIIIKLKGR